MRGVVDAVSAHFYKKRAPGRPGKTARLSVCAEGCEGDGEPLKAALCAVRASHAHATVKHFVVVSMRYGSGHKRLGAGASQDKPSPPELTETDSSIVFDVEDFL